ncbi:MAG: universal stress protein [Eubacteriales bacterium]
MYKKILAPIDGSEKAAKAALHAADLASKLGAEMTLLYVLPSLSPLVDTSYFSPDRFGNIQGAILDEFQRQGEEILRKVKEGLAGYNVTITTEISSGHPADEIITKINDGGYDLAVMGSRGLGEIKGYLMGSVSNRVSRHASCPVLIVR